MVSFHFMSSEQAALFIRKMEKSEEVGKVAGEDGELLHFGICKRYSLSAANI